MTEQDRAAVDVAVGGEGRATAMNATVVGVVDVADVVDAAVVVVVLVVAAAVAVVRAAAPSANSLRVGFVDVVA